jgi:CO/xanthine dehydrogenase Mo-binding subunit
MVIELSASMSDDGKISALEYDHWTARHMLVTEGHLLAWRHSGKKPKSDYAWGGGVVNPQYDIPNLRITRHITEDIVRPMSLRTPGGVQSVFAFESFMDELAVKAGEDPVAFRLRHLKNERAIEVVQNVVNDSGWKSTFAEPDHVKPPGRFRSGKGFAYYELYNAHLATVVHVELDMESGKVLISEVWVVADHGEIMNPDGLLNQYEGGTLQGISRSLYEHVEYLDSKRVNIDWVSYPVIRYRDLPEVNIRFINRPELGPIGAGEPSSAPVPAAIANAIYDACGIRLRTVPFTPERIKAALSKT